MGHGQSRDEEQSDPGCHDTPADVDVSRASLETSSDEGDHVDTSETERADSVSALPNKKKVKIEDECMDALPEAEACLSELSEDDPVTLSSDDEDTSAHNSSVTSSSKQCRLHVRLCAMNANSSKEKTICLHNYPSKGKTIKLAIEKQLGIPVCVQVLSFNSQVISNDTLPNRMRMREGDTVVVSYPSEADISYLSDLIATLKRILSLAQTVTTSLRTFRFIGEPTHVKLSQECDSFNADNVLQTYFSVFPTGSPNSNQLYFIDKGGLKLLLQIYSTLHQLPWHELPYEMQLLEFSCLKIVLKFSATLGIRYLILQQNIIDQVFKSLMRTKIRRYHNVALPGELLDHFVSTRQSIYTLAKTVYTAVVVTGNLSEIPECRLKIASTPQVVEHMIDAMLSTTYNYSCARYGLNTLMCLSFSEETHMYLCTKSIVGSVLEICDRTRNVPDWSTPKGQQTSQVLVEFFAIVFFAQLISSHWMFTSLPEALTVKVIDFMNTYLEAVSYTTIHEKMQEDHYYCSTFIPFLQLVYIPEVKWLDRQDESAVLYQRLCHLCTKTGLTCMKNLCLAENIVSVVEHEGLADYITCTPWILSSRDLQCSAQELVLLARDKITLQPPSLTNQIKAHLAANRYGLEKVLKSDAYSLILQLQ